MRGGVNPPGFFSRLAFALGCFVRLLVDARFADAVRRLLAGARLADDVATAPEALPAAPEPAPEPARPEPKLAAPPPAPESPAVSPKASARVLLALLQREGRLVDFLEQPVDGFSDADVGAAARVVHAGCRKALEGRVAFEPVLVEEEGARVSLTGSEEHVVVAAAGRAKAGSFTVVHRGWRLVRDELPALTAGHDGALLQAAEVE
jgi:hypothetical protein